MVYKVSNADVKVGSEDGVITGTVDANGKKIPLNWNELGKQISASAGVVFESENGDEISLGGQFAGGNGEIGIINKGGRPFRIIAATDGTIRYLSGKLETTWQAGKIDVKYLGRDAKVNFRTGEVTVRFKNDVRVGYNFNTSQWKVRLPAGNIISLHYDKDQGFDKPSGIATDVWSDVKELANQVSGHNDGGMMNYNDGGYTDEAQTDDNDKMLESFDDHQKKLYHAYNDMQEIGRKKEDDGDKGDAEAHYMSAKMVGDELMDTMTPQQKQMWHQSNQQEESNRYARDLDQGDSLPGYNTGGMPMSHSNPQRNMARKGMSRDIAMTAHDAGVSERDGNYGRANRLNSDVAYDERQMSKGFNKGGMLNYNEGSESPIDINPDNEGKFTAEAKKRGMTAQQFAKVVMANKDRYSSLMVKRANFAMNASKWN